MDLPSGAVRRWQVDVAATLAGLDTHVDFNGTLETSDGIPLSGRVSYMAQSDLLLPWATISDNVSLGSRLRGEKPNLKKLTEVIKDVGLVTIQKKGRVSFQVVNVSVRR